MGFNLKAHLLYLCKGDSMKKSFKIAFSSMVVALSLLSMFLAGIFPFAEYTFPAISGILLTVLVIHFGYRYSLLAYLAISILSLILTPNKEAAVLFVGFFGYYPIIKALFERIKNVAMSFVVKILAFNISVVLCYFVMINIFSMTELISDFEFIEYGLFAIGVVANITFIIYDLAVSRIISYYVHVFAPKYLFKFF